MNNKLIDLIEWVMGVMETSHNMIDACLCRMQARLRKPLPKVEDNNYYTKNVKW
jgi:hypothetical protein